MKRASSWILLSLALASVGCSAISDFDGYTFGGEADAGPRDAGPLDAGGGVDAGAVDGGAPDAGAPDSGRDAGPRLPTGIVQTAGGAVLSTGEIQLRISVGAPQPMGHRDDGASGLTLGPGSL